MTKRISELTSMTTPADGDLLAMVDISDTSQAASGSTRKITRANLLQIAGDIVGTSDNQILTNKTIDADNNTCSNFDHGSEVDNPSSGVHGAVGNIVGTSDEQTLTNKTLTTPKINEAVNLTATSSQLNQLDGVTAGTVTASKAVVAGTNKNVDEVHTAALYLGAGAGTQVTSTASELSITDSGDTTEKVLNTQSKCKVRLSAEQTVGTESETLIQFNTEDYDIGSDFDTANYKFVTPVAGYYLITVKIQLKALTAGKVAYVAINVDGTNVAKQAKGSTTGATYPDTSVTTVEYIAAAKEIKFYTWHNEGGDKNIEDFAYETFACVHLLSV